MKIGITERGDPSLDYSWKNRIGEMDGTIIITKNLTNTLIDSLMPYKDKIIIHASCTGYGGTIVEPNIPKFEVQLEQAKKFADMLPENRVVIRVDPIIPTEKGLKLAEKVISYAYKKYGFTRFRVSLLDAYPHTRERFQQNNLPLPYGNSFAPPKDMIRDANMLFSKLKRKYKITIESCAEGTLTETIQSGCVSKYDFELLGLDTNDVDSSGFQRKGCLCCSAKTELLEEKKQCPYKCLYCYWKN